MRQNATATFRPDSLSFRRMLVVEDDPDQADLLTTVLQENRVQVVHVPDGEGCLRENLEEFDAILLDENLPDAQGTDLLQQILSRRDMPVIIVTGADDYELGARALKRGAMDYVRKNDNYLRILPQVIWKSLEEFRQKKEHQRLRFELERRIEQYFQSNQPCKRLSITDTLTGLYNHSYLQESLEREMGRVRRLALPLSMVLVDLDHFRPINEAHGHLFGDYVLVRVAGLLKQSTRDMDLVARFAGGQFLEVFGAMELEKARDVAERQRERIEESVFASQGRRVEVTASFGMTRLRPERNESREDLIRKAHQALCLAKQRGGNRLSEAGEDASGAG